MEKYLFRGKRIDNYNYEWVEGQLLTIPVDKSKEDYQYFIITEVDFRDSIYDVHRYAYEVDPKTVSQFTGLTDKNDKKIFKGDIVLYNGTNVGVVDFADGSFGVRFGDGTSAMFLCFAAEHSVVIGNIYDDQELCKVYNLFIMCS